MEFRIAVSFTDSLSRLISEEQKQVKLTVFDLQQDPSNPGHSFHKLGKAKDPRFWSVRVSGNIRIRFTPPENSLTRFEVSFLDGFAGDDSVLVTPQFFKMAFQQSRVDEVPGVASSGTLNLATGEVSDLKIYAQYRSTALFALVSVNPTFPKQPLSFPGPYGSAWAQFEQRPDGLLDFTFYGSTYVPLGDNILWPLNFFGATQQFATIPANGTVMHPHLQLSTKEPEESAQDACPDVPFNTLQELTLFTHNSSFGDAFTLSSPELGGKATGRSHVLGRAMIQFGDRCGNSVPVAISLLNPGGMNAFSREEEQ